MWRTLCLESSYTCLWVWQRLWICWILERLHMNVIEHCTVNACGFMWRDCRYTRDYMDQSWWWNELLTYCCCPNSNRVLAIVVKYYIKRGLTIPCLSSYYYIEISKVRDTNIKNLNTFPIIWSVSTIPIRIILRWMKNHIKISLFPTLVMWIQIAHALYTLLSTKQTDILKKVIEINICRKFQLTKAETSWKFIIKCEVKSLIMKI